MKNSTIVKLFCAVLVMAVLFGVVLPWLISAANTAMVIVGLVIIAAIALGIILYVNNIWINYKNKK